MDDKAPRGWQSLTEPKLRVLQFGLVAALVIWHVETGKGTP